MKTTIPRCILTALTNPIQPERSERRPAERRTPLPSDGAPRSLSKHETAAHGSVKSEWRQSTEPPEVASSVRGVAPAEYGAHKLARLRAASCECAVLRWSEPKTWRTKRGVLVYSAARVFWNVGRRRGWTIAAFRVGTSVFQGWLWVADLRAVRATKRKAVRP